MEKLFDILKLLIEKIFKKSQKENTRKETKSQNIGTVKNKENPLILDKLPITMTVDERKKACTQIAEYVSNIEDAPNGHAILRDLKYSCVEAVRKERIGKSFAKSIPYPYGWLVNSLEVLKSMLYYLSKQDETLFAIEEKEKFKEKIRDIKVNLGTLDRLVAKNLIEAIKQGQLLPESREMLSFSSTLLLNLDVCYDPDQKINQWTEEGIKVLNESSRTITELCKNKECEDKMMILLQIITNPNNYYDDKK